MTIPPSSTIGNTAAEQTGVTSRRLAARIDAVQPSPLAGAAVAFLFLSSGIGLLLGELGSSASQYLVQFLGPVGLWLAATVLNRQPISSADSHRLNLALIFVSTMACLSATSNLFDPVLNDRALLACLMKTGGMVFVFTAMARYASCFTEGEVRFGLTLFAALEFASIGIAYLAGLGINENAVGVRLATSGLVFYSLKPPTLAKRVTWLTSLAAAFWLQCRTSMVASVAAVVAQHLEKKTRGARGSLIAMAIVAILTLTVLGNEIADGLHNAALRNLHSSNPIARFFLSDKSRDDLSGDFLDRTEVWAVMFQKVMDRPLLGYGIGSEAALFRMRSHNAYLSLLVEGGVGFLLGWLAVYGTFVYQTCDLRWTSRFADTSIGRCQVVLFSYLVLAAAVESSGVGSIATPNNAIFMFCTIWVASRLALVNSADPETSRQS
ncbi:MAG: O-antigen ligase family protein [Planctomycetota bacterium]